MGDNWWVGYFGMDFGFLFHFDDTLYLSIPISCFLRVVSGSVLSESELAKASCKIISFCELLTFIC